MVSLMHIGYREDPTEEDASQNSQKSDIKSEANQETRELTAQEKSKEKWRLWMNIIGLCLSTTLAYSSFDALLNSTTSLIPDIYLGNLLLIILSATQIFSAVFLSYFTMTLLGTKWALVLGMGMSSVFGIVFYYPVMPLVIVVSIICGLFTTITATAAYSYASNLGYWYQRLYNGNPEVVLPLMNGLVTASLSGGFLWGNLFLFFVLNTDSSTASNNSTNSSNNTITANFCGTSYCNEELYSSTSVKPPRENKVYILLGVFIGMTIVGAIITMFLRNISHQSSKTSLKSSFRFFSILKESYSILKEPKGFLPIVIIFFAGIEEVFTLNVFTQAYITCFSDVSKIGYIMFAYGIAQIVMASSQWLLLKFVGRIIVMSSVFIMFLACYLYLLLAPSTFNSTAYFIIAILFGIGDANIVSTIFSIYAILFEDNVEGAVAVANLWWSLGCFVPFLWNQYLCVVTKLYISIGFGVAALLLYLILEYIIYKKIRRNFPV